MLQVSERSEIRRGPIVSDAPCREGSITMEMNDLRHSLSHLEDAVKELTIKLSGVLRNCPRAESTKAANGHSPDQSGLAKEIHDAGNQVRSLRDVLVDVISSVDV